MSFSGRLKSYYKNPHDIHLLLAKDKVLIEDLNRIIEDKVSEEYGNYVNPHLILFITNKINKIPTNQIITSNKHLYAPITSTMSAQIVFDAIKERNEKYKDCKIRVLDKADYKAMLNESKGKYIKGIHSYISKLKAALNENYWSIGENRKAIEYNKNLLLSNPSNHGEVSAAILESTRYIDISTKNIKDIDAQIETSDNQMKRMESDEAFSESVGLTIERNVYIKLEDNSQLSYYLFTLMHELNHCRYLSSNSEVPSFFDEGYVDLLAYREMEHLPLYDFQGAYGEEKEIVSMFINKFGDDAVDEIFKKGTKESFCSLLKRASTHPCETVIKEGEDIRYAYNSDNNNKKQEELAEFLGLLDRITSPTASSSASPAP